MTKNLQANNMKYMATSKTISAPQPDMASTPSLNPRLDTSRTSNRLTASEIESLRKDDAEAREKIRAMIRK